MAFIDLTYSDGGSRRFVKADLGERPLFVDEVDASRRFRLIHAVRGGGNGVVFAAQQLDARERPLQTVAVKVLRQLDEGPRDRFANEKRVLAALHHRSITTCHGAGRGEEIAAWPADHAVGGYVIIDDHANMGELHGRLVQTHPAHGLQPADVPRAIAMLMTSGPEERFVIDE
jgi:hypothetical protein